MKHRVEIAICPEIVICPRRGVGMEGVRGSPHERGRLRSCVRVAVWTFSLLDSTPSGEPIQQRGGGTPGVYVVGLQRTI